MSHRGWIAFSLAAALLLVPGCGGGGIGDLLSTPADADNGGGGPAATATPQEEGMALDCFDRLNAERGKAGLAPLAWLEPAAEAAFLHSADMYSRDFFDHVNPDAEDPAARLSEQGVPFSAVAENIAMGYLDAGEVMDGWMSSAGHRTNMLNPSYTHVGIGVRYASGGPYWTQDFIR